MPVQHPQPTGASSQEKEWGVDTICHILKRRGFTSVQINPREDLVLPRERRPDAEYSFYRHLSKYSFRLFLRDVIKHAHGFHKKDLLSYCSDLTAERYLKVLSGYGVIQNAGPSRFRMTSPARSFGDTFEWFVAQVFQHEFHCPAAWGIKIKKTPSGGDFDVIALVEGAPVYVETKSSPPKHVEQKEISAFLDRIDDLNPHVALFLEDTHLRMRDKIVVMFEEELKNRVGPGWKKRSPVEPVARGLFAVDRRIFIINSRPHVASNIGVCLRIFLKDRGISFPKPR